MSSMSSPVEIIKPQLSLLEACRTFQTWGLPGRHRDEEISNWRWYASLCFLICWEVRKMSYKLSPPWKWAASSARFSQPWWTVLSQTVSQTQYFLQWTASGPLFGHRDENSIKYIGSPFPSHGWYQQRESRSPWVAKHWSWATHLYL